MFRRESKSNIGTKNKHHTGLILTPHVVNVTKKIASLNEGYIINKIRESFKGIASKSTGKGKISDLYF